MSFSISFSDRQELSGNENIIPAVPAGEKAVMLVKGAQLHSQIERLFPRHTSIIPLTSHPAGKRDVNELHTYQVSVHGYSLEEFDAIVYELLNGKYEEFRKLLDTLLAQQENFF